MTYEGAIGIDLGTTYSCVGVWQNERVEIIANDQGNRTTPSYVAFVNNEVLVGDAAKSHAARGSNGVIFDAKRLIGRKFSDSVVQSDMKHWPFKVEEGEKGGAVMRVEHLGEGMLLQPEQISARVLAYLKSCAESYLGKQVAKAVVTVPAYFNDSQRQATKDAGTIAGLEVLRIINEPTAAAIAYGLDKADEGKERNVLVFDFGGGTFDVSIISVSGGVFEVKATNGDTHLGGEDVDAALLEHALADIRNRYGIEQGSLSQKMLSKLRSRCEEVKRVLSHSTVGEIALDGLLPDGEEYVLKLTRARLEELCTKIFARCLSVVQRALKDASMKVEDIEDVVLVGGSSRIPAVQAQLRELFRGKQLCSSVHPDEAVAYGAAVQAHVLSGGYGESSRTAGIVLLDVVPLSIGVEVDDGKFDVIIRRNTTIPYLATKEYSTVDDNQSEVEIQVFEGERPLTRHNHRLGSFVLDGITPAKHGEPTITVTFSVDADGILTVTAAEELGSVTKTLVVENSERLTSEEVQKMIEVAQKFALTDATALARMEATERLTQWFDRLEAVMETVPQPYSEKLQKRIAFLPHGKEWVGTQLHTYTDAASIEAKVAKIERLAKRALKSARREGKDGWAPGNEDNGSGDDNDGDDNSDEDDELQRGRGVTEGSGRSPIRKRDRIEAINANTE
ncbi:heat shock protein 70, putative [Trypanosoma brucei gambiense DAL972]|uniref:Heat shock protein 70, putative n=1 Tax=Trypanosoma brucei gambiense (strain MHOM/CI/86/DAL972) TaxID=679716 RepID=D0A8Z2_TRYB9|nr:heat shock protein 70, putative [Trypanosoma brucei gambiense DAL972]CBH18143.1 heat shock protein 70, putative [Trypanosoma brucei gambiense DAL972]|eukprot:XP_011780407.1 heat shock protein 70, putative [Trypanosoma brucei gambiense DAL972]